VESNRHILLTFKNTTTEPFILNEMPKSENAYITDFLAIRHKRYGYLLLASFRDILEAPKD
jgi:hypothetical protein